VARLLSLVRQRIGPKLGRRIDADDVVQSTYRTFFMHAANGDYRVMHAGDLWRLLASIALHKLCGQAERHTAARRCIQQENADGTDASDHVGPSEPTAAEVVAITEQLQITSKQLTPDQRAALLAHLDGDSNESIATRLGKSPRTVRRLLAEARQQFERQLLADADGRNCIDEKARQTFDMRAPLAYGDYTIERMVGAGGMGKVYCATDRVTGDRVAIKTLHKSCQRDRRVVEKFLEEGEMLAHLRHPNIVGVRGIGRYPGGGYFLVMDFIDGTDLQTRLARGALVATAAAGVVCSVARAIAHAHSHGIVHGDLKPANILVGADGRIIVTDFGLAQFVDASPDSRRCLVGGTAGYIAPEVQSGTSPPTPAADIYALGALLTALVTGSPRNEIADMRPGAEPAGTLPQISARCLNHDPRDRYQTVVEFLGDMEVAAK
jgi:DNA-directed RNA polymerase specialized sigma24 family protein